MNLAGPWPIRVTWLVLPVVLGPALDAASADRSRAVGLTVAALAWAAWTAGIVAVLVPRTVGLTYLRIAAPAGVALATWGALGDADAAAAVVGLVAATAAAVAALAPTTGDAFVNGSAYGPERRFALRPPAALLFGPVELVWLAVVGGAIAGPLLLAAEQWVAGVVALVVGVPVAVLGSRSLHQLARRWLVFVPAGVVVHDPTALAAQLLRRQSIRSIGPAPATTDAHDLTGGAPGLALEVVLAAPVTLELLARRGTPPPPVETDRFLVTPTRPGAVLAEAAARRLPVGVA